MTKLEQVEALNQEVKDLLENLYKMTNLIDGVLYEIEEEDTPVRKIVKLEKAKTAYRLAEKVLADANWELIVALKEIKK